MHVLLLDPPDASLPPAMVEAIRSDDWRVSTASNYNAAVDITRAEDISAVLLASPSTDRSRPSVDSEYQKFIRHVERQRIAAIVLEGSSNSLVSNDQSLIDFVDRGIAPAELRGRLFMIDRYHGHLSRVEQELHNMERLGKRLNEHFREVDQEMRLAGRLQYDFLPSLKKPFGNLNFAGLYRPASWVSGDMYDVFRIDEHHIGMYIADAVGHGMAASLLTMFIKRAIVSKRVNGSQYTVLSPSETIGLLNKALLDQALPNYQFVTACYAVIDQRTLTLRYARGGHPYPLLISPNGTSTEIKTSGGLLGLFDDEDFPTMEMQLQPGDKLLLYTDGVELAFQAEDKGDLNTTAYQQVFEDCKHLPVEDMMRSIENHLDTGEGSLSPRDDVTLLGFEVLGEP